MAVQRQPGFSGWHFVSTWFLMAGWNRDWSLHFSTLEMRTRSWGGVLVTHVDDIEAGVRRDMVDKALRTQARL